MISDGRTPPSDVNAEAALLGCILMDNALLGVVSGLVKTEDFYLDGHRVLFEQMKELAARQCVIDAVTVGGALRDRGKLEAIGGATVLQGLCDLALPSNVEAYAELVRTKAQARRVIYAALEVAAKGFAIGGREPNQFIDEARVSMIAACEGRDLGTHAELLNEIMLQIWKDTVESSEPTGLVKTGIGQLDKLSGGLWPGLLTVLAARPGMGKSSLAQNIATNIAASGKRVLFLSLEDTPYFIGVRQIARFANLDNTTISTRSVPKEAYTQMLKGMNAAANCPLWVLSGSGLSSAEIRSLVLRHRDKHGLDMLVLDHLAEVREDAENETQAVSKAARAARDLAMELYIPALYAHQLNRKLEDRQDKRPNLSDLKQSGKIEEVARAVWFLYRDGYYSKEDERRDAQLIIAKANHGRTGMVKLWANLSEMYYRDWDPMTDGEFPKQAGVLGGEAPRTRKRAIATDDFKEKVWVSFNEGDRDYD